MTEEQKADRLWARGIFFGGLGLFIAIVFYLSSWWWGPSYSVWQRGMQGRANLSQADYERQVQVVNAQANLQAQKYNAQSEIVRAHGVAQANNIVKHSITDQYIRYLWVQTLDKGKHDQIIYVPTDTGLPITEAGRAVSK